MEYWSIGGQDCRWCGSRQRDCAGNAPATPGSTGTTWPARSNLPPGELAAVLGPGDRFLGQAFYSAKSRIALRLVTYGRGAGGCGLLGAAPPAGPGLPAAGGPGQRRLPPHLRRGRRLSRAWWRTPTPATWSLQTQHPGLERLLPEIIALLERHLTPKSITLRHDAEVRRLEGLPLEVKTVSGELPDRVEVREGEVRLWVDIRGGQKTGLFLDQRENRAAAAALSRGRVLDAFAYQGAFAMHLAPRAEHVTLVESSAAALEMARENGRLNNLDNLNLVKENVFAYLKAAVAAGQRFDCIVLDPPAFARSRGERTAALKGYREINRRAFQLLSPGGVLITCSCSYNLSEPDFLGIVREAAAEAHRQARLVERRGAARDHPALLSLPESLYLKCLILEVL